MTLSVAGKPGMSRFMSGAKGGELSLMHRGLLARYLLEADIQPR